MLLGHGPHHVVAAGVSQADQLFNDAFARILRDLLGISELLLADDALANQDFSEVWNGAKIKWSVRCVLETPTSAAELPSLIEPMRDEQQAAFRRLPASARKYQKPHPRGPVWPAEKLARHLFSVLAV